MRIFVGTTLLIAVLVGAAVFFTRNTPPAIVDVAPIRR